MNRREILKTGLGSLAAASAGWPDDRSGARGGLADQIDPRRRALCGRQRHRPRAAHGVRAGRPAGRAVVHRREPPRRRHHDRLRPGQAGRAGRPHHPRSLQRHRHRAGDPAQRALRPGEGFFRPDAARQRAAGAGDRAEQGHQERQGAGGEGQGEARRAQLRRRRHRHAAASGDGALSPGRGLRRPARAVQGRARGADRGDDRPHRYLFLPDHAGAAADPGRQGAGARGVELQARVGPARCADHDRGRRAGVRSRFLGRRLRAEEDAARRGRQDAVRDRQGDQQSGDPKQAHHARRRADGRWRRMRSTSALPRKPTWP